MSCAQGAVPVVPVSVIISTRNRGSSIVVTIESILQNDYPDFELLVVDQSVNNLTEIAIQPFRAKPHFRYIRTASKGLGVGHNLGISQAKNELIAITDDDCSVSANWLHEVARAFELNPQPGVIFGNVEPCFYDLKSGYVPVFERDSPYLLTSVRDNLYRGLGIGACMALKKSVWQAVQGFDQMLGPGSPRGSLEDRDFAIRALLAGYYVYHTPALKVTHYGFRYNKELRYLAFGDWLGFGNCYAKYLKCGHWQLSYYMLRQMWLGQAVWRFLLKLKWVLKYRRLNITPVGSFWFGFFSGLVAPVDYNTCLFKPGRPRPKKL